MWLRPMVIVLLCLLDLGVIGILMLQLAKGLPPAWGILLPTLAFNVFGAGIFWSAKRD
jgi:lipopolysaccharide export LptBFGC system permease protein LptF